MGRLIYSAIMSLDGFIEDSDGRFDWAMPDEEEHAFINDLTRPVGTYLYGRRMYEMMVGWETGAAAEDPAPVMRDFAQIWQAADKVVFSRTLADVSTRKTRLEREFLPESIQRMKASAEGDLAVGGANLAESAFRAGLVDECQMFVAPALVGAGKRALPEDVRLDLELLAERRFGNGAVYLRYAVRQTGQA